eukprot:scaffold6067_cov112-Isochrysis_galbana.AAC.4
MLSSLATSRRRPLAPAAARSLRRVANQSNCFTGQRVCGYRACAVAGLGRLTWYPLRACSALLRHTGLQTADQRLSGLCDCTCSSSPLALLTHSIPARGPRAMSQGLLAHVAIGDTFASFSRVRSVAHCVRH